MVPEGTPLANSSCHNFAPRPRSMTKTQASSRAVLTFGLGRSSSLSFGYARRIFIVVACSRSYASRNCCFGFVAIVKLTYHARCHAIQEQGAAAKVCRTSGEGKDLPRDLRGVESRDGKREAAGKSEAEEEGAQEEVIAPRGRRATERGQRLVQRLPHLVVRLVQLLVPVRHVDDDAHPHRLHGQRVADREFPHFSRRERLVDAIG